VIFRKMPHIDSNFCENIFIHKVINLLEVLDDSYNVILTNRDDKTLPYHDINKKNIVIFLSDERGIIPRWAKKADYIFRNYGNNHCCDYKKIFPIPCGYVGPFEVNGRKNTYFGEEEKAPLIDRKHDLFYSGQKNKKRVSFINNVNKIQNNFKSFIQESDGFRQGLWIPDYFSELNQTKIALVPNGVSIPESFRYMEGFESNCIVITTYPRHIKKYNLWYHRDSPAIFLKDWSELNVELVRNLLTTENLNKYFELGRDYYNKFLSTKAVSDYILSTIVN
jgi:hypothetical protein